MHILVVNDDGPPSPHSSPYVHSLVRELQAHGHVVSVCLPHTQRSWIGKAHMIGQTVKPLYYRPPPASAPAAGLTHDDEDSNSNSNHDQSSQPTQQQQNQQQNGNDKQPPHHHQTNHGTTHPRPSTRRGTEEWILVDGTPASCVQIGLHHFFRDRGPIDLVVSGPNYGRNTTAVFALSSGTLGGALEAALCRVPAVALSYAFFSRNHDKKIIEKATRQGVRVIEALVREWPKDGSVDLYSVNVPLLEGLEEGKVLFTGMLQNYWGAEGGSCFTEVDGSVDGEDEDEERIREGEREVGEDGGEGGGQQGQCHTHKHFKWSPRFTDVYKSVDEAPPGNDGWAVKEGHTSVTPLKANFFQSATEMHGKELKLGPSRSSTFGVVPESSKSDLPVREKGQPRVYALIDYDDDYVQPLIMSAMEDLLPPDSYTLVKPPSGWSSSSPDVSLADLVREPDAKILQIMPYESLDFDFAATHPGTCLVNSYMIRKALIRKHFLSATIDNWVAKHPDSMLKTHVKRSEAFEVDYAEFLDDALVEAFDLRESMDRNAERGAEQAEHEWWILKPSMSDRGQGIRLFSTMEQLQAIFDGWEVDSEDEDTDAEEDDSEEGTTTQRGEAHADDDDDDKDHIMTSHLRHFVAQPYIHPPLLLPQFNNRKFHIRVYVLCVGSLSVYVYRDMLALFAAKPYTAPGDPSSSSSSADGLDIDLDAHLTNTCLHTSTTSQPPASTSTEPTKEEKDKSQKEGLVHPLTTLTLPPHLPLSHLHSQIYSITGDLFEAAARTMTVHFQPLANAFEVYGLDFLVDAQGTAWLLEVNAFPDFRQSGGGEETKGVVEGFWRGVVRRGLRGFVVGEGGGGGASERIMATGGRESGRGVGKEGVGDSGGEDDGMVLVREVDLGRRWG